MSAAHRSADFLTATTVVDGTHRRRGDFFVQEEHLISQSRHQRGARRLLENTCLAWHASCPGSTGTYGLIVLSPVIPTSQPLRGAIPRKSGVVPGTGRQ